jgi:hypothetical protein
MLSVSLSVVGEPLSEDEPSSHDAVVPDAVATSTHGAAGAVAAGAALLLLLTALLELPPPLPLPLSWTAAVGILPTNGCWKCDMNGSMCMGMGICICMQCGGICICM